MSRVADWARAVHSLTAGHAALFVSTLVHVGIVAAMGHGGDHRTGEAPRADVTVEVEAFLLEPPPPPIVTPWRAPIEPPAPIVAPTLPRRTAVSRRHQDRAPAPMAVAPSAPPAVSAGPDASVPPVAAASAGTGEGNAPPASTAAPAPQIPAGPSAEELGAFMASYGASVHARVVAQVHFPEAAARAGVAGTVIVEIAIDGAGRLVGAQVVGDAPALLKPAALEAVTRAAPFGPPPGPLIAGGRPLVFQLPVRFVLR